MFKTENPASAVTVRSITKLNPTPAMDLWIAEAWDRKPAQTPVSPAPPPCMTTASPALTWEFMTAAPVHTPAPLRIVPTNITRRDANPDMSGMQTTKPAPATHRFTNMPVPEPPKRAADRPATANINHAPVPTAKLGTAKNASAIQVTNTPATAPTRAPAEPVAAANINLVTAAEHMIGTEAPAAVHLLTSILVPEPVMPEATEPAAMGNMKAATAPMVKAGTAKNASVLQVTNTPATAPVTLAAPEMNVAENINHAPAPVAMNGKTEIAKKKSHKPNGENATVTQTNATLAAFFTVMEPAVTLPSQQVKLPLLSSYIKVEAVPKLWPWNLSAIINGEQAQIFLR